MGIIQRVIYIVESPLDTRDDARFGVSEWLSTNISVEVWEVHHLYLPRSEARKITHAPGLEIKVFESEDRLETACAELEADTAVILLSGVYVDEFASHRRMLSALMRSSALLTTVSAGTRPPDLPDPQSVTAIGRLRKRLLHHLRVGEFDVVRVTRIIVKRTIASAYMWFAKHGRVHFRGLDLVWVATNTDSINPYLLEETTRIRYLHSFDYERVRQLKAVSPEGVPQPVYLDTMGPLHPDFDLVGYHLHVSPRDWFRRINLALEHLDVLLGQDVVIAAHPRAEEGFLESYYPGRKIAYGETAMLIRDASLVIVATPTTSLGMVALFRKPAVVIRVPELWDGSWRQMQTYIDGLDLEVLNYLDIPSHWSPRGINEDAYTEFLDLTVKRKTSPNLPVLGSSSCRPDDRSAVSR